MERCNFHDVIKKGASGSRPITSVELDCAALDYSEGEKEYVHIKIKSPRSLSRPPIALIAVIDTSAILGEEMDQKGQELNQVHLTRMQMMQHILRALTVTLLEQDQMALVGFNSKLLFYYHLSK